jgi:uncharacterized protein
MQDFLAALGLLLAIEGLLFAAFPNATRRAMREASESPDHLVRWIGVVSAVAGVALLAMVRKFL